MSQHNEYYNDPLVKEGSDPRATPARVLQSTGKTSPVTLTIDDTPTVGSIVDFYVPNRISNLDPGGLTDVLIYGSVTDEAFPVTVYQVGSIDGAHWTNPSSLDTGTIGGTDIMELQTNHDNDRPYLGLFIVPDDSDNVSKSVHAHLWVQQSLIPTANP